MIRLDSSFYDDSFAIVNNNLAGALCSTCAAVGALCVVDDCDIVNNMDSVGFASAFAHLAADAADCTSLTGDGTLVLGGAGNGNLSGIGNGSDDVLGAYASTSHAANASFVVNDSSAVFYVDCVKCASVYAGTQTEASECTSIFALAEHVSSSAVLNAGVDVLLDSVAVAAGAHNLSDHTLGAASFNAHDRSDLSSNFSTCSCALVGGSFACSNCCCVAAATGETATTAVCTGQQSTDCFFTRVNFDCEYSGSDCQSETEESTHDAEYDDSINYISH